MLLYKKSYLLLIFSVLAMAVFGISLHFDFFIFDDFMHVSFNKHTQKVTFDEILWYWKNSRIPLSYNVWQIISLLFGRHDPYPFRLFSILLHSLNTLLVFIWLKMILEYLPERIEVNFAAFAGSLYFLFHPIHVENIVWVSSLKGLLSTFFGLLSLIFFLKISDDLKNILWSFIFFTLGLLAKPNIAVLPLLLIFLGCFYCKFSYKKIIFMILPFFILGGAHAYFHSKTVPVNSEIMSLDFYQRLLVAVDSLRFSLFKAVLPIKLSFIYSKDYRTVLDSLDDGWNRFYLMLSVLLFLAGMIFCYLQKRLRLIFWGILIFLILVSVNCGFFVFIFQNISTFADRYAYFPSIGLALVFAGLLIKIKKWRLITGGAVLTIFLLLTLRQVVIWRSSETVLANAFKLNPHSYPVNISYGNTLISSGKFIEAEKRFKHALTLSNWILEPNIHLLRLYTESSQFEKGIAVINLLQQMGALREKEVVSGVARFFRAKGDLLLAQKYALAVDLQLHQEITKEISERKLDDYEFLADYYLEQKDYEKGQKYLDMLYKFEPQRREIRAKFEQFLAQ